MSKDALTTFLAIWAGLSTLLNLGLAFWNFRMARHKAQTEMPYIPTSIHFGHKIMLGGPNAGIWKIDEIRLIKPKRAEFLQNHIQYDDEGSISVSHTTREGRTLKGGDHYLIAESSDWPVELLVTISLKSAARTKRSLRTRLTR